jgi:hypothetical protein
MVQSRSQVAADGSLAAMDRFPNDAEMSKVLTQRQGDAIFPCS